MNFEALMKQQAKVAMQAYADFEALKRVWKRESQDQNTFSEFTGQAPVGVDPQPKASPEASYMESGYTDFVDQWKSYMLCHLEDPHAESFPDGLELVASRIDIDDPRYASGVPMGIPESVYVPIKDAGKVLI